MERNPTAVLQSEPDKASGGKALFGISLAFVPLLALAFSMQVWVFSGVLGAAAAVAAAGFNAGVLIRARKDRDPMVAVMALVGVVANAAGAVLCLAWLAFSWWYQSQSGQSCMLVPAC